MILAQHPNAQNPLAGDQELWEIQSLGMHEITTEKEPQEKNTKLKIQTHQALSQQGYQAGFLRSNSSIQV